MLIIFPHTLLTELPVVNINGDMDILSLLVRNAIEELVEGLITRNMSRIKDLFGCSSN